MAITNMHATIEELLEVLFSAWSMLAAITSRLESLESETGKYTHESVGIGPKNDCTDEGQQQL
jgi:hypothetical protein